MAQRRVLLIVNTNSRNGREGLPAVRAAFAAHGFSVLVPSESELKDCPGAIARLKHEVDLIVVGGGDGSLNCAAAGLLGSKIRPPASGLHAMGSTPNFSH